jgi:hypothetical protein
MKGRSRVLCVGEDRLLLAVAPAHNREPVAALDAALRVEREGAEEGARLQSPGRGERILRIQLEAVRGDQRDGVRLACDGVDRSAPAAPCGGNNFV